MKAALIFPLPLALFCLLGLLLGLVSCSSLQKKTLLAQQGKAKLESEACWFNKKELLSPMLAKQMKLICFSYTPSTPSFQSHLEEDPSSNSNSNSNSNSSSNPQKIRGIWLQQNKNTPTKKTSKKKLASKVSSEPKKPDAAPTAPAAPTFFLSGGPGQGAGIHGDTFSFWKNWLAEQAQAQVPIGDIIIYDPRGTGLSTAPLTCQNSFHQYQQKQNKLVSKNVPLLQNESIILYREFLWQCFSDLQSLGISISSYSTSQLAEDLLELSSLMSLRQGYHQKINLLGVSYGSRLALELMQKAPERIQAAVFDAAPPFNLPYTGPSLVIAAFEKIFTACAKQASCTKRYGKSKSKFLSLLKKLQKKPQLLSNHAEDGKAFLLDANLFLRYSFQAIYHAENIALLPSIINDMEQNRSQSFFKLLASTNKSSYTPKIPLNRITYFSVACQEGKYISKSNFLAQITQPAWNTAAIKEIFSLEWDWHICGHPIFRGKAKNPAPSSSRKKISIPTLLLSGEFDPVLPPSSIKNSPVILTKLEHVVFPSIGHGLFAKSPCARLVISAFLQSHAKRPLLSHPCLAEELKKELVFK